MGEGKAIVALKKLYCFLLSYRKRHNIFLVVIQLGAILAVVMLYFRKLNPFVMLRGREPRNSVVPLGKDPTNGVGIKIHTLVLWIKVVIACVPAGVAGF